MAYSLATGSVAAPGNGYFLGVYVDQLAVPTPIKPTHVGWVDSTNTLRWGRFYGTPGDKPVDLQRMRDSSLMLLLHNYEFSRTPGRQIRLLRLDPITGDSMQSVLLPAPAGNGEVTSFGGLSKMLVLRDGGLLIPASTDTLPGPGQWAARPFLRKLNAQLQPVWSYVYRGSPGHAFSFVRMLELQDGSVLALAAEYATNPLPLSPTYQLHHLSAAGRLLRLYSVTSAICNHFILANLIADPNGRTVYVTGGCTTMNNYGAYVARVNLDPTLPPILAAKVPDQHTATTTASLDLFPNPASETVTLRYQVPAATAHAALHLYDATGRLVRRQALAGRGEEARVAVAGLRPGLYLAVLLGEGGRRLATRKLAVEGP